LLETYRECLRDFFDMPALTGTLADIRSRRIRLATVDSDQPSPFAASLLFSYVASFLYDGDAPLAERRAQALAVDQAQLRDLIGDIELRELLDAESMRALERELQRLDPRYRAKSADGVHDMLLSLGDLTAEELAARTTGQDVAASADDLVRARRVLSVRIAGQPRSIAVEDAARYRDALGVPLPVGIPEALLAPAPDPLGNLVKRYARTHAPFGPHEFAARYALGVAVVEAALARLTADGQLVEGEFTPGGTGREWTDAGVLRQLRRRSLAKLRHEIEPVDQSVLGRLATTWQGVVKRRQGADALLDAIEQLQGAPLPASILETEILPARIDGYDPADLDAVASAGEVVWIGVEPLGARDGRIALYLADHLSRLLPPDVRPSTRSGRPEPVEGRLKPDATTAQRGARDVRSVRLQPDVSIADDDPHEAAILKHLRTHGASFFGPLHDAAGGGYPNDSVAALWNLVWKGLITNDTFHALRAFTRAHAPRRHLRKSEPTAFRSRRVAPQSAEGRWTLVVGRSIDSRGRATAWASAWAQQLLARHGVLTREAVMAEASPGGFGVVYPVLKAMEESGRVRRGYFVAGLGATQFALPGSLDLLRSLREPSAALSDDVDVVVLSAVDPANPYGAAIKFPSSAGRGPTRSVGATVILVDGALAAWLARGDRQLVTFLPEAEPERSKRARAIAHVLIDRARAGGDAPRGMLVEEIDGLPPAAHPLAPHLLEAGFVGGALGYQATFHARR
jgi:ATP-dependent helicase Lhr and Lhr-like helicase